MQSAGLLKLNTHFKPVMAGRVPRYADRTEEKRDCMSKTATFQLNPPVFSEQRETKGPHKGARLKVSAFSIIGFQCFRVRDSLSMMSPRPCAYSRSLRRATSSFSSRTRRLLGSSLITALQRICLARSAYLTEQRPSTPLSFAQLRPQLWISYTITVSKSPEHSSKARILISANQVQVWVATLLSVKMRLYHDFLTEEYLEFHHN